MPPVRVLQVFGRLDRGGAETMLMELYRNIDRNLIHFDFVIHTTQECDYSQEVRELGGNIYSMEPFTASKALFYRRRWRDFFSLHKGEYDVIHAHMRSTASIFLDEAKKAGIVTIAHSHNTSSGKGFSAMVKDFLQRDIPDKADYLFACTERAGEWLYGGSRWGDALQSGRAFVLKNGINTGSFIFDNDIRDKKRREFGLMPETGMILHVGRLEEQKNHRFLLAVIRELKQLKANIKVYLCGTGPLESELKELAKVYGIGDNVIFLGTRQDVRELLQAADLMLFPSVFEGLPVTLVEAQCTGLPVMASERIDSEIMMTDRIRVVELSKGPWEWAQIARDILEDTEIKAKEEIKDGSEIKDKTDIEDKNTDRGSRVTGNNDRINYPHIIRENGYDAAENAKWLQDFYAKIAL